MAEEPSEQELANLGRAVLAELASSWDGVWHSSIQFDLYDHKRRLELTGTGDPRKVQFSVTLFPGMQRP